MAGGRAGSAPPVRRPTPRVDGGGLEAALLSHVERVGVETALDIGQYHFLTRDKAVHAASLAKNPDLVGGFFSEMRIRKCRGEGAGGDGDEDVDEDVMRMVMRMLIRM